MRWLADFKTNIFQTFLRHFGGQFFEKCGRSCQIYLFLLLNYNLIEYFIVGRAFNWKFKFKKKNEISRSHFRVPRRLISASDTRLTRFGREIRNAEMGQSTASFTLICIPAIWLNFHWNCQFVFPIHSLDEWTPGDATNGGGLFTNAIWRKKNFSSHEGAEVGRFFFFSRLVIRSSAESGAVDGIFFGGQWHASTVSAVSSIKM